MDYESVSDGCSGGLSAVYAIAGRKISCHWICVLHDFLYTLGGDEMARHFADILLMHGAAGTGKFAGWRASLRRVWRWCRSRVMLAAVRVGGRRYWGTP
ncbi:hypothetical protein LJC36_00310 [Desulfovibrio sp. OttesenSCG-928-C14]|nr:hypothetical protein [Desulfovibrio sp. OttesenSCG-928-C14]